jgi:hypothetical protein
MGDEEARRTSPQASRDLEECRLGTEEAFLCGRKCCFRADQNEHTYETVALGDVSRVNPNARHYHSPEVEPLCSFSGLHVCE